MITKNLTIQIKKSVNPELFSYVKLGIIYHETESTSKFIHIVN